MLRTFFLLLLLPYSLFAAEVTLKEKLAKAQPGSFLVIDQSKTYTLLYVHDRSPTTLRIEEVSIPAPRFARCQTSWRNWFEQGAPGNTLWTTSQIDLDSGKITETFSFTHQGWVDMSDCNPFLATLLNLPFHEVPDQKRRRIGFPPGYNKPDYRPLWNPRLIVDGCPIPNAHFTVWKARWPADGSDLSRKIIEIYLPQSTPEASYPDYFPYWLEVEGKIGSAKVRIVDSGKNIRTIHNHPPLL